MAKVFFEGIQRLDFDTPDGKGFLLSGVCGLLGLIYTLCFSAIFKHNN